MQTTLTRGLGLGLIASMLIGCAMAGTPLPSTDFVPAPPDGKNLVRKVDGFAVVVDASESMAGTYQGGTKFNRARETVRRLNLTLPELGYEAGLRRFGQTRCPFIQRTAQVYGTTAYDTQGFAEGLGKIAFAGGNSPLAMAIEAAGGDLEGIAGPLALIVVSDGKEMSDRPIQAARVLTQAYGQRLCIHTIQVGDDAKGGDLLRHVAEVASCGTAVAAEEIMDPAAMAGYVKRVFLAERRDTDGDGVYDDDDRCPGTPAGVSVDTRGCPLDTDGDGVTDDKDRCPGTPAGVSVDTRGCPLDTDGDGVTDDKDRCPGTPAGVKVDARGCSLDTDGDGVPDADDRCPGTPRGAQVNAEGCWVLAGVYFDTASAKIKSASFGVLDRVAGVLKNNAELKVEVQGHTDNVGRAAYNRKLSEARAEAVRQYLVGKGVSAGRLSASGYGYDRPIASNDTAEGLAKNRRVELKPLP